VLALLEEIQKRSEAAQIERRGAQIEQVIVHPHELCEDGSQIAAARCELNSQELFNGVVPGNFIGERRQVVHPVDNGHVLVEVQMLAQLFEATVQVTDVGNGVDDLLTVQREHQTQGGVRRRVLRSEIQSPDVFAVRSIRGGGVNGSQRHERPPELSEVERRDWPGNLRTLPPDRKGMVSCRNE